MNIILMTKNKPICHLAYQWCRDNRNINLIALVAPNDFHYSALNQEEVIEKIGGEDVDLIVSFLYWRKIKEPLISYPRYGCINFHPAPLPEFKGVAPYVRAIIEGVDKWGVTSHFIDEGIDTGDIIKINEFDIDHSQETSASLSDRSAVHLFSLFKEVLSDFIFGKDISRLKQSGGSYFGKNDLEKLREIKNTDSGEMIDRKTRAFWCPPHDAAYYVIDGYELFAVPTCVMRGA